MTEPTQDLTETAQDTAAGVQTPTLPDDTAPDTDPEIVDD